MHAWFIAAIAALLLALAGGCAARAPGSAVASPQARAAGQEIDAVLPAAGVREGWRVFQLGARRHAVVPGTPEAWSDGVPRALAWRALAAPSGPFRPVQAVPGQRGYFYVVDAASGRLCLYDAEASLLSTFPLPPEFTPFPAGRAAVFRGADGAFTFVDYGSGEAWQFADRQTLDAGATRWVPRGRVKLPSGARECVQPAGFTDLFCRDAAGAPLRFDGALNRVAPRPAGGEPPAAHGAHAAGGNLIPRWRAGHWVFEARLPHANPEYPGRVLFRYHSLDRTWARLLQVPGEPVDLDSAARDSGSLETFPPENP